MLYLCFADESGTHGASRVLVVGGIVIHEEDVWHLQAADLVAYALYRYYSRPGGTPDARYMRHLWAQFDSEHGRMHGLIHDCPYHRRCRCPACTSRQ